MKLFNRLLLAVVLSVFFKGHTQQDPHFTQYMYNTMTVNPAYAGTSDHTILTLLARTQWVGFEGAPDTQTLSLDTPLNWKGLGLGVNLMNDMIGPVQEIYGDLNMSYSIITGKQSRLSFGLKGGMRFMSLDRGQLDPRENLTGYVSDIERKILPTMGAGLYYYTNKYYAGISVPNIINTNHYNTTSRSNSKEELHFFAIAGYVFDLSNKVKFKPAAIAKAVQGAPLSIDVSANFMFFEKFHAGLAWRWDDALSALVGFQINKRFHIGYAFDYTTSPYRVANNGTHELLLKYYFQKPDIVISPRFF